jgi:hypothetical protein
MVNQVKLAWAKYGIIASLFFPQLTYASAAGGDTPDSATQPFAAAPANADNSDTLEKLAAEIHRLSGATVDEWQEWKQQGLRTFEAYLANFPRTACLLRRYELFNTPDDKKREYFNVYEQPEVKAASSSTARADAIYRIRQQLAQEKSKAGFSLEQIAEILQIHVDHVEKLLA